MNVRHLLVTALLLFLIAAAGGSESSEAESAAIESIHRVLDDFHDAAARGDRERYLGNMSPDAVFLGTDEWERWPKQPDFTDYVAGRFRDGSGWSYRSVAREIQVSDGGDVGWFDEVVFSEQNGRFRGTGVLIRRDGRWKIVHYAMSFLIFNEDWEEVIELTRETRRFKESAP